MPNVNLWNTYIRLLFIDYAPSRYVTSNNVGSPFCGSWISYNDQVWWMDRYYVSSTTQRISRTPSVLYSIKAVFPCIEILITMIMQSWVKTYLKDIFNGSLAFANEKNDVHIEHGYHMTECPLGAYARAVIKYEILFRWQMMTNYGYC